MLSGRHEYTDPGEKFENVTAICYRPVTGSSSEPEILRLVDCTSMREVSEDEYFELLRSIYNDRNPHAPVGEEFTELED